MPVVLRIEVFQYDPGEGLLSDETRRKTVVDAALDLAEELSTGRIEFLRSVVRSAGETLSKE